MAIPAGPVTMGAIIIISFDLVGRQLVKVRGTAKAAPHGHLSFLSCTVVYAGGKIISDLLVACSTLICIKHRGVLYEVIRVCQVLFGSIAVTIVTTHTTYGIVTGCHKGIISGSSHINPVVGLIVGGITTTTARRGSRIWRVDFHQPLIVGMADFTVIYFWLRGSLSGNLIIGTSDSGNHYHHKRQDNAQPYLRISHSQICFNGINIY
jgi:hypothetical protein